ncbi:hypothetical protein TNCV_520821 [Trichonephila clavipes]|nr:hypothetical protein TNCV_520821 [Trichonephila clavipes]
MPRTIHLQTSMSSPGFEPSPNGAALSVTNRYTGWAFQIAVNFNLETRVTLKNLFASHYNIYVIVADNLLENLYCWPRTKVNSSGLKRGQEVKS